MTPPLNEDKRQSRAEVAAKKPPSLFQWRIALAFWLGMHLLLAVWVLSRPQPLHLSWAPNLIFLLLVIVIIFSLTWVLGTFRLPRQIIIPLCVLTAGIVLTLVQAGFFGAEAFWQMLLPLWIALGFLWVMGLYTQIMHKQLQAQQRLLEHDGLTGLLNRVGVQHLLHNFPYQHDVTLMTIDVNDLKVINDLNGHDAGDQYLHLVARALSQALPEGAVASRWGGDEFLVILPEATGMDVHRFAQAATALIPKIQPHLSPFAYGTARFEQDDDLRRVLVVADQQMYNHKDQIKTIAAQSNEKKIPSLEEFTRLLETLNTKHNILQQGLDNLCLILGFEGSAYYEIKENYLQPTYVTGIKEQFMAQDHGQQRCLDSGLLGQSIKTNSTIGTADYANSPYALPGWTAAGLRSLVSTPVRDALQIVGVICLTSYQTWRPITPQARRLLEAVGLRLGHVLERDRVVMQIEQRLESSLLNLGVALEARDAESFGHTQRVVASALDLGKALQLPAELLSELKQGASLHDIGKLAVPDAILRKPSRLTAEEHEVMQHHTQHGFELASRMDGLSSKALEVILSHHENWDGSGYPHGLKEEQIPLLARIFAVCDVYDALINIRPYKPAWSSEEALQEIEAQAGKKFDPAITKIFVQFVRRGHLAATSQFDSSSE